MEERANFLVNEDAGTSLRRNLKVNDSLTMEFARDDVGHYVQIPNFHLNQSRPDYYSAFKFLCTLVNWFDAPPEGFNKYCLMHVSRDEKGISIKFRESSKNFDYSKGDGITRSHSNIPIPRSDPFTKSWLAQVERRIVASLKPEQNRGLLGAVKPGEKIQCNFLVNKDGSLKRFDFDSTQTLLANQALLNLLLEKLPFEGKPRNPRGRLNTLTAANIDGQLHLSLSQNLISGRIGELLDQE